MSYKLIECSPIKNEYSYKDFFWIEVIHNYMPNIYKILYKEPEKLLKYERKVENVDSMFVYEYLSNTNSNKSEEGIGLRKEEEKIVKILFDKKDVEEYSIKRLNNYYKYFLYRLPTNVISNGEFLNLLKLESDVEFRKEMANCQKEGKYNSLLLYLFSFKINIMIK